MTQEGSKSAADLMEISYTFFLRSIARNTQVLRENWKKKKGETTNKFRRKGRCTSSGSQLRNMTESGHYVRPIQSRLQFSIIPAKLSDERLPVVAKPYLLL
jgi:hypothetical protein